MVEERYVLCMEYLGLYIFRPSVGVLLCYSTLRCYCCMYSIMYCSLGASLFLFSFGQVVTTVLEALKSNDQPYHNHGVEVRLKRIPH